MTERPFWETLALEEMNTGQWESLCDGCGRCCALKAEDPESGQVHYTSIACRLLDTEACRCTDYANRARRVPDCAVLDPERARSYAWLPDSCAYRRLALGKPLLWWHPLVSGDPASVHEAGISVRGKVLSEKDIHPHDLARMLADLDERESDE